MTMTVTDMLDALDRYEDALPIDDLVGLLEQTEITLDTVRPHVRFAPDSYCRNLLRVGPTYSALILCWRCGQTSPVHDHRGSACAVRVISGTASERRYRLTATGGLVERDVRAFAPGHVCGSYDADIHAMYNDQPGGEDLVTLHVYTPPLADYHTYCLDTGDVRIATDHLSQTAWRKLMGQPAAG
ncbi:MAG: cysteine dioxygenase family protein [Phycisphaerales bacterium]|nr:cysteine dioxygenase family protein [Phycisphaerae bacterium]NNF44447.1 cysteine dioxygenase family protein [Phycisphaerales bacterium]NNM25072.1 cysteine dioxygenase family protein [Phycisphaerales bacterium]